MRISYTTVLLEFEILLDSFSLIKVKEDKAFLFSLIQQAQRPRVNLKGKRQKKRRNSGEGRSIFW
jgi:hypothetical protein